MAFTSFFSLTFCFLVLFHGCFGQIEEQFQFLGQSLTQEQKHRLRPRSECRIERLNAQEPNRRYESEAGLTEFWDRNDNEFGCAGVKAVRHVVQPKGLLLPAYNNAPQLFYVLQGRGIQGTVIPGCAETYEDPSRRLNDRHQKVQRIHEGDVIALPAGVSHWAYNDGDVPLKCVALIDTSNEANQLDEKYRKFFLAGNSRRGQQQQSHGKQEHEEGHSHHHTGEQEEFNNIFNGFDDQLLSNIFNVDDEIARKLKGQDDNRGSIVRAERFTVIIPEEREREAEQEQVWRGRTNGLEETLCTLRLQENLGNPSSADVYNPRGGRVSVVNSEKLPVLNLLQLSAERGFLYRNAIMAPHWNVNAHCAIYVIRGSSHLQIVGDNGKSVFNNEVQEGQFIIVPQNFAVIMKAGNQGFEYVSFKTNDNAISSELAGRVSSIRAMPEEVLANSYNISREDARSLKYNRDEFKVFSPSGSRSPKDIAFSVVKSMF